jgi:ABC-type molybdate transport system substrate-binding protein
LTDLANSGARFIIPAPSSATTTAILSVFDKASANAEYGADFRSKAERNILARDGDDAFVVSRIASGEVDAGVVYASRAKLDPQSRSQVQQIDIPDPFNTLVDYPIAVLKHGTNARGGRAFVSYALAAPAQAVFSRWGFTTKGAP